MSQGSAAKRPLPKPAAAAPPVAAATRPQTAAPRARIGGIDALRGFDMFWIVGGQQLALAAIGLLPQPLPDWAVQIQQQLEHRRWEGFTAWDLIMPLFLFVVGVAMPFSFSRRVELGHSKARMYWKIIRRFVILFILGMAVQGHLLQFDFDPTHKDTAIHPFSNTLQAIAVGYLIAGILLLNFPVWAQVTTSIFLMVGYWALLMFVPVPDRGAGVLDEHANIALAVDQWVLGPFIDGTDPPYTWVLSGMTFTAAVLLGVFAGHILRSRSAPFLKVVLLIVIGLACLASGWAWAEYGNFPIIKHIWTSSMVLWAAGWSYLLLALFYLVVDVVGLRFLAFPFIVIGMNAITAYVMFFFIPFRNIASSLVGGFSRHFGNAGQEFTISLTTVLLVWLVLYHLYRQKIFLRI